MIFQHAGAAPQGLLISSTIFLNSWPAGLYPDVITRVKFQVDQSKGLEATAYRPIWLPKIGCFSASHDCRLYNSVTHYRDTL